jgi:hypothetical protein
MRRLVTLVLVVFAVLVIRHAQAYPMFEASDEAAHFIVIHRLANEAALPVIPDRAELNRAAAQGDVVRQWDIESHQPPLYYAAAALVVAPLTTRTDLAAHLVANDVIFTWGVREGNPNVWLHPPHDTGGDTVRAVWLARMVSLAFGLGTLVCVYGAVYTATGVCWVAFTALLLAASVPMFVVVSGSVTNDSLIILLSAAVGWWALRLARDGLRPRDPWVLGLLLGAAALTKITGLSLFGLVGAALLVRVWRRQLPFWAMVRALVVMVGVAGVVAGWWYVRNLTLYGDLLATEATAELWGRQFGTAGESGGWQEAARLYRSFWLMLGHLHAPVWLPVGFYGLTVALVLAAVAGWFVRRRVPLAPEMVGLAALGVVLPVGMLLVGTRDVDISYGRLLFPGLVGVMLFLAVGWGRLVGRWAPVLALPLTVTSALLPSVLTVPAYAPVETVEALPAEAVPLDVRADGVRLVGYRVLTPRLTVGEVGEVAVYFVPQPEARPLVFAVTWVDGAARLGGVTRYPGMAALDMLRPNQMYRAVFRVPVQAASDDPHPHLTSLQLTVFDASESPPLPLTLPDGSDTPVVTLDGMVYRDPAATLGAPNVPFEATFGDVVRLEGYTLDGELRAGETVTLSLWWVVQGTPPPDVSATVQVLDATGGLVAQDDDASGRLPSRVWLAGDRLVTRHSLTLPADAPSGLRVVTGWYRLDAAFTRLAAVAPTSVADLAVLLEVPPP